MIENRNIKAIIGLGNPGPKFHLTRHNIGFLVLDELAEKYNASFQASNNLEKAEIQVNGKNIILIKPQTFMNNSGQVIGYLQKKGIKPEETIVVHDELEVAFGKIKYVFSGGARGHNGLRSIIATWGADFNRLRVGIGRPENKEDVPDYVLSNFSEPKQDLNSVIKESVNELEKLL
ncbi:MAG: aminoacyl-tRNA hydrolase [Candidatus Babeliales bacterium]|nr:aminoacyl-tRNA hydrolase [Candidatus Babeliales bacterium]